MLPLDDVDALKTTAYELGMEVEDAKAETEQVVNEIETIRQEQAEGKKDVRTARQRIATAERRQKNAESNLAKEKRKTQELRREKKAKGDLLRYYEKRAAAAKTKAGVEEERDALKQELETLHKHCTTLSVQLRDVSSELFEKEEEVEKLKEELVEEVTTFSGGRYTEDFRMLIYSLLSKNIAHDKIPSTIEECFRLAGKRPSHVPTAKTVGSMNIERLALSQRQLLVR